MIYIKNKKKNKKSIGRKKVSNEMEVRRTSRL